MPSTNMTLPERLQKIVEDFEVCDGEEKLELLLEFSDNMPPLPDWLQAQQDAMEPIHECMTPVAVHAEFENGGMAYYFDIPPEAPTIRGYAAVLADGLRGATPEQVLSVPPNFFQQMGLHKVVGPQRLNGMAAMLAYLKRLAFKHMNNDNGAA